MNTPSITDESAEALLLRSRWTSAQTLITDRFGYPRLLPAQHKVLDRLFQDQSVLAVMPTGHGKSLCYQLASQVLPGLTIVVSPLISLMKDQCDSLTRKGIAAVRLDQSISADAFAESWQRIRQREAKLLFVAPERFFNERFPAQLQDLPVSLLAIDEAHCMSEWGHQFRPDYLRLAELVERFAIPQTLALTATATPAVIKDIRKNFSISSKNTVRVSTHRNNLRLHCTRVQSHQRDEFLLERLGVTEGRSKPKRLKGATLIYVTRRSTAEQLRDLLSEHHINALVYHAGLSSAERDDVQREFVASDSAILIGTIAFGMGVDKPDIRRVIHYNPSQSIESYSQEIGRGGRDGKACQCETLLIPEDQITLGNLASGNLPSQSAIEELLDRLAGQPDRFFIALGKLSWEINLSSESIASLMIRLQSLGYVRCLPIRYDVYRVTPKFQREAILARVNKGDRETTEAILSSLAKGKKGFRVNLVVTSNQYDIPRDNLVEVIEHNAIAGLWTVQTSDMMHGYTWIKRINRKKSIAKSLLAHAQSQYQDHLRRIENLMAYFECRECLAIQLAAHFGHRRTRPCGRCSFCTGNGSIDTSITLSTSIGRSAVGVLDTAKQAYPEVLEDPLDQAKFLCGVSTNAFRRHRIYKDPGYGTCDHIRFLDVFHACTELNPSTSSGFNTQNDTNF